LKLISNSLRTLRLPFAPFAVKILIKIKLIKLENMSSFNTSEVYALRDSVDYSNGATVSKIVSKNTAGNITLFAFDKGQSLSKHTAPFDAFIQILDGKAKIIIDDNAHDLSEGEGIIMPANISHAVEATERFKMLLVMIKG